MIEAQRERLRQLAWDADCAGDVYVRGVAWRALAGDESAIREALTYL